MTAPRRSAISVQLLTQFGLDHGVSADRCLAGTGLDWQLLSNPGAEISSGQELILIRNLVEALGHVPGIGLQAGLRYRLSTYGICGFAMLSSPTLRDAFEVATRYVDLTYTFHALHTEEHDSEFHLMFDDSDTPDDVRVFMVERDYAAAVALERDLISGSLPVFQAHLRLPEPADLQPYIDVFGLVPSFNAPENRVIKDGHLLDLPLPAGNSEAARQCEEQCKMLLAKRRKRGGLAGSIRDRMLARPGLIPSMEQLADELHLTSRTMRRRLADEGTSFRQLQDEVRQALAEELLAMGSLRLEEISDRLGYGEVSNFIHAFKRWKGTTPHQYRSR